MPDERMRHSLLVQEAVQTLRRLDEVILDDVAAADTSSLLGIGHPAWTRGTVHSSSPGRAAGPAS